MDKIILTEKGLEKLKLELDDLKKNRRPKIIERLKAARALGDLSENSEYDDARNEQSFIEGRIEELEDMVKKAKIIKNTEHGNIISMGTIVKCKVEDETEEYEIVSSVEADPLNCKISIDSPLGKALLGKKKGDKAMVNAPAGDLEYSILSVS